MSQNPGSSFSLIDHTADLGFEVLADSLPKLMEEAAKALFSIIADLDNVKEDKHLRIEMPTDSPAGRTSVSIQQRRHPVLQVHRI